MASNSLDFLLNLRANTSGFNQGIDGAKFAVNALVAAMAALGLGLGVKELAEAADSYANLSARVNIATKDTGNFTEAMAGIHRVALETNSNLEATAALFTRLNTIGKDMGMTQQQALDLTKTVTQAIQVGGGSAQASEAAVTQFIQAMQGGVLRGEEFNSIMENGYGLAEALAKGLGVTTGELRKMAENGELGAERVLKALESQKKFIEETYAQMPLTIGNALQKIATSWQILIGEMDQANGASATVAQWLSTLADNMELLKPILDDIGEGFVWIGDQLKKQYDTSTIQALYDALESAYDGIKSLLSTLGDAHVAVIDILDAALSSVFSFTNAWRPAGEEVSGFQKVLDVLNVGLSILSDGFKAIGIVVNLFTGALFSVAAAYNQVKSVLTWGGVKEQAIANMNAMTEKANEYYKKASDGAMNFESSSIKALTNIGKTDEQRNQDRITDNEKTLTELKAQEEKHKADYKVISDERIKLNQQLVDARKSGDQSAIDAAIVGLAELDKKEKDYQAASKKHTDAKIRAAQDWADAQIEVATKGGNALDEQTRKTIAAKIEAQGLAVEFDKTGKAIVKAVDSGTQAVESTGNATDKARKAASALGVDLDIALNRVSEKFEAGGKSVDDFSNGLEGLGATGEQAATATYQAWQKWLETAKSQAEIDAAKAKLQEFGDKGAISTKQVEMGLVAIKRQAQELPADIDPVTAAFERLGIKTKEQLALAAQSALSDFNTIQSSGQATSDQLRQAYERTMQAAAASGDQAVISAANAKAASLGLSVEVDSTGKATVQSYEEMSRAAESHARTVSSDVTSSYRQMGQVAREEAKHSIEAWNEALSKKIEEDKKKSESQNAAISYNLYSEQNIVDMLKQRGFDDAQAEKLAESIMIKAFDADKGLMSKNMLVRGGQYANELFKKNMENGLTAQGDLIEKAVANASVAKFGNVLPPAINVDIPSAQNIESPSKTVKYEISLGGNTVELYGDASEESSLNAFMSQLEQLKKGM